MKFHKILFLIMFTMILFFVCNAVFAQDAKLVEILNGKVLASKGACEIKANGELTKKGEKFHEQFLCVLILDPKDEEHAYLLIIVKGKINRLIKTNTGNTKQEVLWRNPDSMV